MKNFSEMMTHLTSDQKVELVNRLFSMLDALLDGQTAVDVVHSTGMDKVQAEHIVDTYHRLRDDKPIL